MNTAEVAVATVAFASLVPTIADGGLRMSVLVAMLVGGVVAAPLAAWLVRFIPPRAMGLGVAGLLLLTNVRELSLWSHLGAIRYGAYALTITVVVMVGFLPSLMSGQWGRHASGSSTSA